MPTVPAISAPLKSDQLEVLFDEWDRAHRPEGPYRESEVWDLYLAGRRDRARDLDDLRLAEALAEDAYLGAHNDAEWLEVQAATFDRLDHDGAKEAAVLLRRLVAEMTDLGVWTIDDLYARRAVLMGAPADELLAVA
jgi:hypothetical protein